MTCSGMRGWAFSRSESCRGSYSNAMAGYRRILSKVAAGCKYELISKKLPLNSWIYPF